MSLHIAVVGATGLVGREMLRTLEARQFPHTKISLLASARSAGKTLLFNGEEKTIIEATPEAFEGIDEMRALVRSAYRRFYGRPGYVARKLAEIRSFADIGRLWRGAGEAVRAAWMSSASERVAN